MAVYCGKRSCLHDVPGTTINLFLYRFEHTRLSTFIADAEYRTELLVEFGNADRRQADILHMVQVRVQALCKAAQGKGFFHAGAGRGHCSASSGSFHFCPWDGWGNAPLRKG